MTDETSEKITMKEAIRRKHNINKVLLYGGYNVKEISDMEDLTEEQYSEVNRQLSQIRKHWWLFPDYFWVIGIALSSLCFFYFHQNYVRISAIVVVSYCTSQLAYRAGLLYGYVRGYKSGHEEGIHKALGISDDEAS